MAESATGRWRASSELGEIDDVGRQYPRLRLGIDVGTTRIKIVCAKILREGHEPSLEDVKPILMGPSSSASAPAIFLYGLDDHLVWGHDAQAMLQDSDPNGVLRDRTILLFKMALWAGETQAGQRALAQLKKLNKSVDEVAEHILKALTMYAVEKASKYTFDFTPSTDLPVDVTLCVPQLWHFIAKKRFLQAARKTGVASVRPVPESFSAAVFLSADPQVFGKVKAGTYVVTADVGGGTADFSTLRVGSQFSKRRNNSSNDLYKSELTLIGTPESALCGSQFINERFLDAMRKKRDFSDRARKLGITVVQYEDCLLGMFEDFKVSKLPESLGDSSRDKELIDIGVDGGPRSNAEARQLIQVSRADLRRYLDPTVEDNIECLKRQLERIPEDASIIIQIPGGLGACRYFIKRVETRFADENIIVSGQTPQQEVASVRGGCMRYSQTIINHLPQELQIGIVWDERFNRKQHPDAVKNKSLVVTSLAGVGKSGKAEDWVQDRLRWILKRGQALAMNGELKYHRLRENRFISTTSRPEKLTQEIFCTESGIKDHEPLKNSRTGENRTDVFSWGTISRTVDAADCKRLGLRKTTHVDGEEAYELWIQLVMRVQGGDVEFGWRLGRSREALRNEVIDDVAWAHFEKTELSNSNFNPFIMPNLVHDRQMIRGYDEIDDTRSLTTGRARQEDSDSEYETARKRRR